MEIINNDKLTENSKSLIEKIDDKLKEINPEYQPPLPCKNVEYNNSEEHTVKELIDIIDEKLEKIEE